MQIVLGTANGLARFDGTAGHDLELLAKGDVRTVAGRWAIVDDSLVAVDDPDVVIPVDPKPWCLAATAAGVLVGTAEARLFVLPPGERSVQPVRSFDQIPTRDEWYTPWGGPPDTRSIARTADGAALVNVHVGGVWHDRGDAGWTEVIDVDADTHQVLAVDHHVVVAAAIGFGESDDNGRTFRFTADGLHASYCRAVAVADGQVLVTASTGPFTKQGAVYRRPLDRDEPFVRCWAGLPEWFEGNIDTFQLAAKGATVVVGTHDGQLFVSHDAGATWRLTAEGLDPINCVSLA